MTIKDVKLFLLDMDGTFYLGGQLIEGSLDFIKKVQESGRDFMFLTNNSSHNANFYVQKLAKMGLNVDRSKVMTSGEATCEKINELYPGKRCFVLGNEFLKEEFAEAGIPVDNKDPEIVVIGFDTTLDYQKMWDVCNFVRAGLPYIATHPDFNCPTETGFMPDIGAIIDFIEASTGRRPDLIVGKPHTGIVEAVKRRTGLDVNELAMVGDRLYTDIETGLRSGMLSILVMSGETTEEMLAESETVPDLKFGRLSDMIDLL
ncbi:MAG: HAD-IIA family hydrolase [Clostridiales bacterium]|nr:HAD-IIA family hydrolase [Clostridiales bacterium]